jgi:hypothetical protein
MRGTGLPCFVKDLVTVLSRSRLREAKFFVWRPDNWTRSTTSAQ